MSARFSDYILKLMNGKRVAVQIGDSIMEGNFGGVSEGQVLIHFDDGKLDWFDAEDVDVVNEGGDEQ